VSSEDLQYFGGIVAFVVGGLVLVGSAVLILAAAARAAFAAAAQGNFAQAAAELDPIKVLTALLSNPFTLGIVAGALIMNLGVVMTRGGTWLWIVKWEDPRPGAAITA
jgi:hypothetical protein